MNITTIMGVDNLTYTVWDKGAACEIRDIETGRAVFWKGPDAASIGRRITASASTGFRLEFLSVWREFEHLAQ
jgi:hypothetical protein